jgi:DnaJ-domain-containing protein 1
MGPLDRTIYLQMSADILCKIGTSKEILSDLKNQILNEMESPAGMAAFAQLPHDKRAEVYEQQGRLLEALGEDPETINWYKENAARERTEDFRQAPRSLEKENAARELLGVGPNATPQEIRKAYHALALKLHPDKNRDDPEATAKFQELNNAFDLLKNAKPA